MCVRVGGVLSSVAHVSRVSVFVADPVSITTWKLTKIVLPHPRRRRLRVQALPKKCRRWRHVLRWTNLGIIVLVEGRVLLRAAVSYARSPAGVVSRHRLRRGPSTCQIVSVALVLQAAGDNHNNKHQATDTARNRADVRVGRTHIVLVVVARVWGKRGIRRG